MDNKQPKFDYSDVKWQENGKLKLCIVVGTRPEIIRLAAVINKCRKYFDVILAHTGQNYDYNLNGVFFKDLKLKDPEVYMDNIVEEYSDVSNAAEVAWIHLDYEIIASKAECWADRLKALEERKGANNE